MAPSERSPRTAGLDGLRGLAALSVLCLHVWLYTRDNPSRPSRGGFWDHAAFELRLGLVCFFVLSGYLLFRGFAAAALRHGGRVDIGRYARRRVARIVPAYYLAIAGSLVLLWGARGMAGVRLPDANALPLFLVFGQNYAHGTFLTLDPVTWTLCVEAAFYLVLPLLGLVAYRLGSRQWLLLAGLVAVGLAWNAAAFAGRWSNIASKGLPSYLPYFACGMAVALWAEHRRLTGARELSRRATAALIAGGFGLAALDALWHSLVPRPADDALLSIVNDLPAGLGFAAVAVAAVAGTGPAVAWIRARPLAWLGLVSYGVYLWHVPLLLFARRMHVLPDNFLPTLALALAAVLSVASASWYLVERPLVERATRTRRRPGRRRGAVQPELEAHAAP
jgi:peptidoglycan/LPS O-acetylase OafA/YrhL